MTTAGTAAAREAATRSEPTSTSADHQSSATEVGVDTSSVLAPKSSTSIESSSRRGGRFGAADPLSDRATSTLIRRTLCPTNLDKGKGSPRPIEDLLPPLTSRNDVDFQLYALISIIMREFVQNWYNKITPDETFVAEIIQIIAHCTRALEERIRKVDLEKLVFDEIPGLLDEHINLYRTSHSLVAQEPLQRNPRDIYHSLCSLPALSPVPREDSPTTVVEQSENEAVYRQLLVRSVLAVLLPTEDLENDCLVALVSQILSDLVIGELVATKLSQPWLIWEGLIILSRTVREGANPLPAKHGQRASEKATISISRRPSTRLQALFWSVVKWFFMVSTFIRLLITTMVSWRSLPSRRRSTKDYSTSQRTQPETGNLETLASESTRSAVLSFRIFSTLSSLIELNVRMPWLHGTLSMLQWMAMKGPGNIAEVDGVLDRFLSHCFLQRYVFDPANLPPLLRSVRGVIFPNNMPGKPTLVPPSSDAELAALKRRCAASLWSLVPKHLGRTYLGASRPWSTRLWWRLRRDTTGQRAQMDREAQKRALECDSKERACPSLRTHHVNAMDLKWPAPEDNSRLQSPGPTGSLDAATSSGNGDRNSKKRSDDANTGQDVAISTRDGITVELQSNIVEEDDDSRILDEIESGILDLFSDSYCNKHLVYRILELVLVRLMPELAEKTVSELWEVRLN
ncbi:hypothetical protein VTK73DRAFT_2995 [Phialemonium thermophilum]|uniref:PXA domain-containing protein n=1 Tax=Phialemonium thermophilum TaxID=223376 RepID=A0ABR3Y2D6_9PEZI